MNRVGKGLSLCIVAAVLALSLSACGKNPPQSTPGGGNVAGQTNPKHCSVIKKSLIVARLGVAYVLFKRSLYNPYKEGKFAKGAPGRKVTIVKAVAGTLLGIHEAKVAIRKANECGASQAIAARLDAIQGKLTGLRGNAGTASNATIGSDINSMNSNFQAATSAENGL